MASKSRKPKKSSKKGVQQNLVAPRPTPPARSTTPTTPLSPQREVYVNAGQNKARTLADKTREYDGGSTSSKFPPENRGNSTQSFEKTDEKACFSGKGVAGVNLGLLSSTELMEAVRQACMIKMDKTENKTVVRAKMPPRVVVRGDTPSEYSSDDSSDSSSDDDDEFVEADTLGSKPSFVIKPMRNEAETCVLKNPYHRSNRDEKFSEGDFKTSMAIAHRHLRIADQGSAKANVDAAYHFMLDAVIVYLDKTKTEEELEERYAAFREYGPKDTNIRGVIKGQLKEYCSVWYYSICQDPWGSTPGYVAKATRDLTVFSGCRNSLDSVTAGIHQKFRKLGGSSKYRE